MSTSRRRSRRRHRRRAGHPEAVDGVAPLLVSQSRAGRSRAEVARGAGLTVDRLVAIEERAQRPTSHELAGLARALGIRPTDLIRFHSSMSVCRLLRIESGLELHELAAAAGVDEADMVRLERKACVPIDEVAKRLGEAMGCRGQVVVQAAQQDLRERDIAVASWIPGCRLPTSARIRGNHVWFGLALLLLGLWRFTDALYVAGDPSVALTVGRVLGWLALCCMLCGLLGYVSFVLPLVRCVCFVATAGPMVAGMVALASGIGPVLDVVVIVTLVSAVLLLGLLLASVRRLSVLPNLFSEYARRNGHRHAQRALGFAFVVAGTLLVFVGGGCDGSTCGPVTQLADGFLGRAGGEGGVIIDQFGITLVALGGGALVVLFGRRDDQSGRRASEVLDDFLAMVEPPIEPTPSTTARHGWMHRVRRRLACAIDPCQLCSSSGVRARRRQNSLPSGSASTAHDTSSD